MDSKTLLNLAGAVLLLVGASGAAVIEDEGSGAHGGGGGGGAAHYRVSWPLAPGSLSEKKGQTGDGQESAETFAINQTNITTVTVRLTWTDNYRFSGQSPATVSVKSAGPGVPMQEKSSGDGRGGVTLDFSIQSPPNDTIVEASGEKEATAKASKGVNFTKATGAWNLTVSVKRDYKSPVHGTGSVSWTASVTYQAFSAAVKKEG